MERQLQRSRVTVRTSQPSLLAIFCVVLMGVFLFTAFTTSDVLLGRLCSALSVITGVFVMRQPSLRKKYINKWKN